MVGLSVILENFKDLSAKKTPQVISKGSMIKPPSSSSSSPSSPSSAPPLSPCGFSFRKTLSNLGSTSGFLDRCFLCNQKLLPDKDIYMYKGDRAFCSVECRCRQIFMDEEEGSTIAKKDCTSSREYNCSLAAIKGPQPVPCSTTSSPSSSRSGKGPRYRSNAFAC